MYLAKNSTIPRSTRARSRVNSMTSLKEAKKQIIRADMAEMTRNWQVNTRSE